MNINLTVFVQLIYFFIVYVLVERFLLKPAVALILQEDQKQLALQNQVNLHKKNLEDQELHNKQDWLALQSQFLSTIPKKLQLAYIKQNEYEITPLSIKEDVVDILLNLKPIC